MKTQLELFAIACLLSAGRVSAHAQGTAFTYQGRLNDSLNPANGTYDLRFVLYTTDPGGSQVGPILTNTAVSIGSGLFTVALDFGANVFTSADRFLEIGVRTNGGGGFSTLSPRQKLTPTPYAIFANSVSNVVGTLSAAQLTSIGNSSENENFFLGVAGNASTSGFGNTADGFSSLLSNSSGSENVALGALALYLNTMGSGNVALGSGALELNTSGSDNIAIGEGAGQAIDTGNNNIDIGNDGFGDESNTIRIGSTQTKVVVAGLYNTSVPGTGGTEVVCVNGQGFLGTAPLYGATINADLQIGTNSGNYRHMALGGGNSTGYLYGSYPALGDGIHLGYNYYYDASGSGHVINTGGATSRISVGYGAFGVYVGGVNAAPTTQRILANSTGVTVNGTFNNSSDRNVKQDFAPISPAQILRKVAQLPISEWSYREDASTRHIGPMGQDFYATFNIGTGEKYIAPIDEGGVALAAIQGLNEKLEVRSQRSEIRSRESEDRIQKLETENAELKQELAELKTLVKQLAQQR